MCIKILCLRTLAKPSSMNEFNKQWMCKGSWPFSYKKEWVGRGRKGGSFTFPLVAKYS